MRLGAVASWLAGLQTSLEICRTRLSVMTNTYHLGTLSAVNCVFLRAIMAYIEYKTKDLQKIKPAAEVPNEMCSVHSILL